MVDLLYPIHKMKIFFCKKRNVLCSWRIKVYIDISLIWYFGGVLNAGST